MADEQIQYEEPQEVVNFATVPEVTEQAEVTVVAVSGPAPIDSIHAAATAIAAINARLDKIDPPKEGNNAQA